MSSIQKTTENYDEEWRNVELHTFLTSANGLDKRTKLIPKIRKVVEDAPKTKATVKSKNLDFKIEFPKHALFCGLWLAPDHLQRRRSKVYVNPNYAHSHRYPGIIVKCDCGALVSRGYDDTIEGVQNNHDHTDECQPFMRLEARAELSRKRYNAFHELSRMGWGGDRIAGYFGLKHDHIGAYARDYGLQVSNLRKEYYRVAGNTYQYLLEKGVPADKIAEIYGTTKTTLGRYRTRYGDVSK